MNKLEPEPQQPAPAAPWHAGWTKAVAAVAGLVVIVATIIGIWGPLWPTAPTFYPETPSAESPLELSFKVKNRSALFPLRNPAIVSMPVSFLCGVVASLVTREPEAEARFDDEKLRTYLGIGAE